MLLGAVFHPHDDALFVGGPDLPSTRNGEPLARWPTGRWRSPARRPTCTRRSTAATSRGLRRAAAGRGDAADARLRHAWTRWRSPRAQLGVLLPALRARLGPAARRRDHPRRRRRGPSGRRRAGVDWSVAGAPTAVAEVCAPSRRAARRAYGRLRAAPLEREDGRVRRRGPRGSRSPGSASRPRPTPGRPRAAPRPRPRGSPLGSHSRRRTGRARRARRRTSRRTRARA